MREDAKAEVLGSIFAVEDKIRESDQGKSFFAFWQLLTDIERSERLSEMIEKLYALPSLQRFDPERRLGHLKYELLSSGEKIVAVTSRLIEQLRRFIDDRVWVENRRILELCRSIEKQALECKEALPKSRTFMRLPGAKVTIGSIAEKRLYRVRSESHFEARIEPKAATIDIESFLHQCYVDEALLKRRIDTLLKRRVQCTLGEVVAHFGVDKGIAELVGYYSIAKSRGTARIEKDSFETVDIADFDGNTKKVRIPKTIFTRG